MEIKMATVTLDSSDIPGILADAGFAQEAAKTENSAANESEEAQSTSGNAPENEDEEDEQGLTAKQREEFSKSMLKTIGKKHARQKAAEEELAVTRTRAENLEREVAELKSKIPVPKEPIEPVRGNFATDQEFINASIEFKADKQFKAHLAQEQQRLVEQTAMNRVAAARIAMPDYDQVVRNFPQNLPDHIADYMVSSELLPELSYYLAKNPEVVDKLLKMRPAQQLVDIGRIESKIKPFAKATAKSEVKTPPKAAAKAPSTITDDHHLSDDTAELQSNPKPRSAPVITPLNSSGGNSVNLDPSKMDTRAMVSDWSKKNAIDLKRRKRH